ncbi:penicillin-binding protein [Podospora conica]|nr:penicillin-binding protein [Schizothecium conicum]
MPENDRLQEAIKRVDEILAIAGAPAVSFAIIRNGETRTYHVGLRDIDHGLEPNDQTRYNVNSLTKGLVSALVGIQIYDHPTMFEWSTPIKDVLPGFGGSTPEITCEATIIDLLSHRWGASGFDDFWFGSNNAVFLPRSEALRTAASLPPASPFRAGFEYNNWGYEIVAQLLEASSGQDIATLLQDKLFHPLGMSRSSMSWDPSDDNVAKSYGVLLNKTCVQVPTPFNNDSDLMMMAAGGAKSTLEDMVIFYKTWMKELVSQFNSTADSSTTSPLRNLRTISSQHARLLGPSFREQGYGLGWVRAQLPGQLGRTSANPAIGAQPTAGKGGPSRLVLYHHGLMPGSTSAVLLVPELQLGVVTLQNSMPAIDTADFISQMLLEALLEVPEPNDYVELSRQFYNKATGYVDRVRKELDEKRVPGTQARPLSEYQGRYWNSLGNFFIDIKQSEQGDDPHQGLLTMTANGLPDQVYALEHYNYDTFSWLMSYDETVRRARVLFYDAEYYLVQFRASGGDSSRVNEILWVADGSFPGVPIILTKEASRDGNNLWATGMILRMGGLLFFVMSAMVAIRYFRRRQSGGYRRLYAEDADL